MNKIFSSDKEILICENGTSYGECSFYKGFYCDNGTLIFNSDKCGCGDYFCKEKYRKGLKNVELNYILEGKQKNLSLEVYKGVLSHLNNISQETDNVENYRRDFKLSRVNNDLQKEFLIPLIVTIKNKAPNSKKNQVRIAISLVQNIPYKKSNKTINFRGHEIDYSRYPYEVLFFNEGVCEEKTALLAFLLKELGYGVSGIYYPDENHEVLGIDCPNEYSLNNTGICFIETTSPAILSDSRGYYSDFGFLSNNYEIYRIAEGESLKNVEEFKDARDFIRLRQKIFDGKKLNYFQSKKWNKLNQKYGIRL